MIITKLTDAEILQWNDLLQDHQLGITIRPRYVSNSIYSPTIGFDLDILKPQRPDSNQKWGTNLSSFEERKIVPEPHIKYNLIFSIDINKIDKFNEIFNEVKLRQIKTPVSIGDTTHNIDVNRVNVNLTNEEHILFKKNYIKFDYKLEGQLADIMGYAKHINDTLELLEKEPKFKVSEVVSDITDKSIDYLVLKYIYSVDIVYLVTEIINNSADTIIKYGRIFTKTENELTWSRTARINEVIDNE